MLKRRVSRWRTVNRGESPGYHTVEQLGPRQALTPEGFLLCMDVPIARIGTMMYMSGEVPVTAGRDGLVRITRDESALFSDEAISSYNGKPVVNEHPDVDVTPSNWKMLAVGIVMNPRRGEDENCDVVVADLLITDPCTIRDVQNGKREVSAGYEADYEQTGDGEGRQTSIIGNHVALVEKGRCGPRCAIGDQDPSTSKGNSQMATPLALRRRASIADTLRRVFKDAEEDLTNALSDAPDDKKDDAPDDKPAPPAPAGGDGHTHIHIHTAGAAPEAPTAPAAADPAALDPDADKTAGDLMGDGMDDAEAADPAEKRMLALEAAVAKLTAVVQKLIGAEQEEGAPGMANPAPVGEGDQQTKDDMPDDLEDGQGTTAPAGKTMDSAALATSFQKLVSDAEVLVPGFRVPTFDAATPRKATMDSMCNLRRSVLDHMASTKDGASLLSTASPGLQLASATCSDVASIFTSVATAKRALNNAASTKDANSAPVQDVSPVVGKIKSLADLNRFYAQHHSGKK